MVDLSGLPLAWTLTGGNRNDVTQLIPLLDGIPAVAGRVALQLAQRLLSPFDEREGARSVRSSTGRRSRRRR